MSDTFPYDDGPMDDMSSDPMTTGDNDYSYMNYNSYDFSNRGLESANFEYATLDNANFYKNPHRQNHHPRLRAERHHRKHQTEDSRQGRNSAGPTATHLCRKTTRRRANSQRL